jgi:uncharacterized protein (TIGR03067 family)
VAKEEQPAARKDQKTGEEKQAQPKAQPAKSDQERLVGNWFITNDDSMRKGEMWVITEDRILMYAKHGGLNSNLYLHRLDAGKDPKQIDITVSRVNGPTIGVIKGIYVLDGDELRLCLGEMGKDRPAAFPEKAKPGEVLVLQRASSGATPPKAKEKPPAKIDQELMVGEWLWPRSNVSGHPHRGHRKNYKKSASIAKSALQALVGVTPRQYRTSARVD